jgi:hypothetical protein
MSVDYNHYLIPRPNSFLPTAGSISTFLQNGFSGDWLRGEGWIAKALTAYKTERLPIKANDVSSLLNKRWGTDIKLMFPLWWPEEDAWHDLEIHVCQDYVYHCSEIILPFESTACTCGQALEFSVERDIFIASRLYLNCPKCGRAFDVSNLPAPTVDGWTGARNAPLLGGAAYRFGLLIQCGRAREEDSTFVVARDFRQRCTECLGCDFYDFGDLS